MPLPPPEAVAVLIAADNRMLPDSPSLAFYTSVVRRIFEAIQAADVSPVGTPPMSNSGGPVGGFGKII